MEKEKSLIEFDTVTDEYGFEVEPAVIESITIRIKDLAEELGYIRPGTSIPIEWIKEYADSSGDKTFYDYISNMISYWKLYNDKFSKYHNNKLS